MQCRDRACAPVFSADTTSGAGRSLICMWPIYNARVFVPTRQHMECNFI